MDERQHYLEQSTTMLVNCSHCRTPLQLPPATNSIRCAVCFQITYIATSFDPSPPPYLSQFNNHSQNPPLCQPYYPTFNQTPNPLPPPTFRPNSPLPPATMTHMPYPQQYQPEPVVQNNRKKAVVCGISYKGTVGELGGTIHDAQCMNHLLLRLHFPESNIYMLTEEATSPDKIPTKKNILNALRWLVEGNRPGDSLVFHYSGHGSQQEDTDGDEIDGLDEVICPLDYEENGMIVDDEINEIIVIKLHAIIDSCYSGTVLDLPYLCRMRRSGKYEWEDHRPRTGVWKGTSGGEVYLFSGCDDDQQSNETEELSKTVKTGAMTYAFIQAIEHEKARTYGSLLDYMRSVVKPVGKQSIDFAKPLISIVLEKILCRRQQPQLTSNEQFDVHTKQFSL